LAFFAMMPYPPLHPGFVLARATRCPIRGCRLARSLGIRRPPPLWHLPRRSWWSRCERARLKVNLT